MFAWLLNLNCFNQELAALGSKLDLWAIPLFEVLIPCPSLGDEP